MARSAVGLANATYVWGGGNKNGPSTGIDYKGCSFSTMVGFDCSGLALYAVYQGTGKQLYHSAKTQYGSTDLGKRVALADLLPGDLVFFGTNNDPAQIYHVAVYVGNSELAEATDFDSSTCVGQDSVVRAFKTTRYGLIAHGMRFWDDTKTEPEPETGNMSEELQPPIHSGAGKLFLSFAIVLFSIGAIC